MNEPVAHSPRPPFGAQTYREHIYETERGARLFAKRAADYFTGDRHDFVETVAAAAAYHDLGKLDPSNQQVLQQVSGGRLPLAHEDAGTSALLRLARPEAAVLVAGHHAGLFSQKLEMGKSPLPFRRVEVASQTDARLEDYLQRHGSIGCSLFAEAAERTQLHRLGLDRRLALSCLVDADHTDTARHYGAPKPRWPATRWGERAKRLDEHVAGLAESLPRADLRQRIYEACRSADTSHRVRTCDAPVGTGKTTAVMAHLLRVAQARSLRHILVVLPFVNIIQQSVDVYRRALVLDGERPEDIVAEHHHQADFDDIDLRHMASLWRAPITVTTAVQFFETLAAARPSVLRKLHELPGSAVFIDEAHAALPSHLWPQAWGWLREWIERWGGYPVLASGSLPRFWELPAFLPYHDASANVSDLVPDQLRQEAGASEVGRVARHRVTRAMSLEDLLDRVAASPGPRLVVVNTVRSAAVIAQQMRARGQAVSHLSSALAPVHRQVVLRQIRERLEDVRDESWTLVATSVVEAGLDLSFRAGFRESASAASFIQVAGRINRHGEFVGGELWDFRLATTSSLPNNPAQQIPQRALAALFEDGSVHRLPPDQLALAAMERELTALGLARIQEIRAAEDGMEYPTVAELCRVIEADTRLVIVDPLLVQRIRAGAQIEAQEIVQHSVRIWASRIDRLPVEPVFAAGSSDGLFTWNAEYDPAFLGYMAGVVGSRLGESEFIS